MSPRATGCHSFAFAAMLACASGPFGCNSILGIHRPANGILDAGNGSHLREAGTDSGFGLRRAPSRPSDESDASEASAALSSAFAWASWPMPSPLSASLPNPQSYGTDVDGVVRDNVTGLEWQRDLDADAYNWNDAASYCASLELAQGGFRLPSRIELLSLIAFDRPTPTIDPGAFADAPPEKLWSASRFVGEMDRAWGVNFGFSDGYVFTDPSTTAHRVRCVRSASGPTGHFGTEDSTVRDTGTRPVWQQTAPSDLMAFEDAGKYCADLSLGGGGWRLPSVKELQTLVDESRAKPAADASAFPDTVSDYYWSSSLLATHDDRGWAVSFAYGYDNFFPRSEKQRVRCVR